MLNGSLAVRAEDRSLMCALVIFEISARAEDSLAASMLAGISLTINGEELH